MTDVESELKLFVRIVVMGVDVKKEELITYTKLREGKVQPSFIEMFPSDGDDKVPAYMGNFKMWAFMEGFKIYDENLKLLNEDDESLQNNNPKVQADPKNESIKNKTKIYGFVMTDEKYCKRYCTTLVFYERYYIRKDHTYSKRGTESTLLTKNSLHDLLTKYPKTMNDHDLIFIPKSITIVSTIPCFDAQKQILRYLYENLFKKDNPQQPDRQIRIPKKHVDQLENLIHMKKQSNSEGSIDETWSQTFNYDRNAYLKSHKKNEDFLIKEYQLREFYISAIFSFLDLSSYPGERVVMKLHNDEPDEEFVRFRINETIGIELPPIGYKALFRKLSAKNIVRIFKAILLEKQVLFFSSQPGEIVYITEAFISLLSPISWCCIYIPNMPISVWEALHAMMPFIIGISSEHRDFISESIDLRDKVVVDLDTDTIQAQDEGPPFSKMAQEFLVTKMEELYKVVKTLEPRKGREVWIEVTLKCRHYFNIFLLNIINNIVPYYTYLDEDSTEKKAAAEVFDFDLYFRMFPDAESSKFIVEVSKTMMFSNFIEESYLMLHLCEYSKKSKWDDQVDEISTFLIQLKQLHVRLFAEGLASTNYINVLHPKALAQIETANSKFISDATYRYYNPEKIDLLPYLIKYYYRFYHNRGDSARTSIATESKYNPSPKASIRSNQSTIESPFIKINIEETTALNRECQAFPSLNKNKIVDLRELFLQDPVSKRSSPGRSHTGTIKLPIFSSPKPLYNQRESQSDLIQMMESHKENLSLQQIDTPINNPTHLLRRSNYFLYYQMVKRNEIASPGIRKLSDYEHSFFSSERNSMQRSQPLLQNSSSVPSDKKPYTKYSVQEKPSTRNIDLKAEIDNSTLMSHRNEKNKRRIFDFYTPEASPVKTERTELKTNINTQRSVTEKSKSEKSFDNIYETASKIKRGAPEISMFNPMSADRTFSINEPKISSKFSSPFNKPPRKPKILQTQEDLTEEDDLNSQAKSARKMIFGMKEPTKNNEDLHEKAVELPHPTLNRSISAQNDYKQKFLNNLKMQSDRKIHSTIENPKVDILKGDLDPSPPTTPSRLKRRIFKDEKNLPVKAFVVEESPSNTKENRGERSWDEIGVEKTIGKLDEKFDKKFKQKEEKRSPMKNGEKVAKLL